jgi:hypothetical protein
MWFYAHSLILFIHKHYDFKLRTHITTFYFEMYVFHQQK